MIAFSPSTLGFYDRALHSAIPADAIDIDDATYRQLLDDQAAGLAISADAGGNPVTTPPAEPTLEEKQARIAAEIAAEAERRMPAPTRADLNEVRRLLVAGASPTQEQIDRWALIDAIEADAVQIQADMQAEPDPYSFDYRDNTRWTEAY